MSDEIFLTIRKDVPFNSKVKLRYPFDQMVPGDCFDAPDDLGGASNNPAKRRTALLTSAHDWKVRRGHTARFCTALVEEGGVKLVRCWMVELNGVKVDEQ